MKASTKQKLVERWWAIRLGAVVNRKPQYLMSFRDFTMSGAPRLFRYRRQARNFKEQCDIRAGVKRHWAIVRVNLSEV